MNECFVISASASAQAPIIGIVIGVVVALVVIIVVVVLVVRCKQKDRTPSRESIFLLRLTQGCLTRSIPGCNGPVVSYLTVVFTVLGLNPVVDTHDYHNSHNTI